jgi:hypothetical protein
MNGDGEFAPSQFMRASSSKAVAAQREEDAAKREVEIFSSQRDRKALKERPCCSLL